MTMEWNASSYETLANLMTKWGEEFLSRLDLRGDESVIDAGCGTGRVTEKLLERLPDGKVFAVDGSHAMVEAAKERFAGDGRVSFSRQNLLELEVEEPMDIIFSTATFHWIRDHDRLFERLAAALKSGGLLAAQCGGEGNISRINDATEKVMRREPFAPRFENWTDDKLYAGVGATEERLREADFEPENIWLHEEPTPFESVEGLAAYLGAIILRGHVEALPETERVPFALAVA
ncbi:MAG: methyltransferase domain-containing protein [Rubrobacter sp.]|nr:methyltransferase domain-containing protein [Rubrobacter sp.]